MPQNKFGEDMPEDPQAFQEQLLAVKAEWAALVERGAPVPEVDAVRQRWARLVSWWEQFTAGQQAD